MVQHAIRGRNSLHDLLGNAGSQNFQIVVMSALGGFRRQPVKARSAAQEIQFLTKQVLEWLVHINVCTFFVFHESDRGTVVHEGVKESLTLSQCILIAFAFGDVASDALYGSRLVA